MSVFTVTVHKRRLLSIQNKQTNLTIIFNIDAPFTKVRGVITKIFRRSLIEIGLSKVFEHLGRAAALPALPLITPLKAMVLFREVRRRSVEGWSKKIRTRGDFFTDGPKVSCLTLYRGPGSIQNKVRTSPHALYTPVPLLYSPDKSNIGLN